MNEKEIIRSESDKLLYVYSGLICLLGIILTMCPLIDGGISTWFDYASNDLFTIESFCTFGGLIFIIEGVIVYIASKNCEIYVTNKKIYGQAIFGKRIDIPVDSITSICMYSFIKGISVSSPSGNIRFIFISNFNEIHKEISGLIMDRNKNEDKHQSTADEIKKYKELLDTGAITQEEFDTKKKQLLNN